MASIKDVANRAGVAISTVSKVLNHYAGVSQDTKDRVNQAIKELNFTPNAVAAALSSKQSGRIALLLTLSDRTQQVDEIDMQYLTGAMFQAREMKLDIIPVLYSMLEDKEPAEIVNYLKAQSIEGIVVYGMNRNDWRLHEIIDGKQFWIVAVDTPLVNEKTSSIWIDQKQAQYDVAKKTILENENCKKVLYIAGEREGYITEERILGMKQLAEELELDLVIEDGQFREKRARELTFQYAKERDVFVCASDLMAIGAMMALTEADIFHPVCGFDGITLMGYAGKQMNTVRQDFRWISAEAIKEIYRLMNGGEGRNIVLDYKLVRMQYQDIIE